MEVKKRENKAEEKADDQTLMIRVSSFRPWRPTLNTHTHAQTHGKEVS